MGDKVRIGIFFMAFALVSIPICLYAEDESPLEIELRFDPYYSSLDAFISLTKEPIPNVGEKGELEVYKDLLLSSYLPRYLVLEASVNPMPVLGLAVREYGSGFYKSVNVSESFNLVRAMTAGFEEPYALSVFWGNVVDFTRPGQKEGGNKGYVGYLLSIGQYHIKDNEAIRDDWYELEWKIKGDRVSHERTIRWSFRVGYKGHGNGEIADAVYLSLRRSRLDYEASAASILKNSGFEYTYDMDAETLDTLRHYFYVNKKWPFKGARAALSFDAGFIWDSYKKYSGGLAKEGPGDNLQIILRPNVEF